MFLCGVVVARCASVTIIPSQDATLLHVSPSNSIGSGDAVIAGTTQAGTRNRALLRYNVSGSVPAGSRVIAARFTIAATRQSGEAPVGVPYGLHRMLTSWGEGANVPPNPASGLGLPANPGDATWATRFFPTNAWAAPGGLEETDYSAQITSSVYIDSLGVYEFESTFEMAADVQFWLDHPTSNFGWMLKSESEEIYFSARKFASRESADETLAPQLAIDYLAPPLIGAPRLTNGAIEFSFDGDAGGAYSVVASPALAGTNVWTEVTNFGYLFTSATLTARIGATNAQRFFRVRID